MIRAFFISLVLVVVPLMLRAQANETLLYNGKGQLKADTNLKITNTQLQNWRGIETLLIKHILNRLEYSQVAKESDLKGKMIISFMYDSIDNKVHFEPVKKIGGGLEECVVLTLKQFEFKKSIGSNKNSPLWYYLALSFDIIDGNDFIESTGSIPISTVRCNYITK